METVISVLALPAMLIAMIIDWINSIAIGTIQVINAGVKILGVVLRGLSAVLSGFASSPKTAEALMGSVGSGSSASYFTAFTDGVKRVWVAVPSEFWWVIMGMMAIGIVLGWVHKHAPGSSS